MSINRDKRIDPYHVRFAMKKCKLKKKKTEKRSVGVQCTCIQYHLMDQAYNGPPWWRNLLLERKSNQIEIKHIGNLAGSYFPHAIFQSMHCSLNMLQSNPFWVLHSFKVNCVWQETRGWQEKEDFYTIHDKFWFSARQSVYV